MGRLLLSSVFLSVVTLIILVSNQTSISYYVNRNRRSLGALERNEPSHITMCRAVLDRYDGVRYMFVSEEKSFCYHESPYSSLMQIFASSFLHQALLGKLKIGYNHRCGRLLDSHPRVNIQMFVQNPMELETGGIGLPELDHVCSECVKEFDENGNGSPDCILFTPFDESAAFPVEKNTLGNYRPKNAMQAIFPSVRHTLQVAAKYSENFVSSQAEAVIYLSCDNTIQCNDDIPFHVFSREIPRSTQTIDIILNNSYRKQIGKVPVVKLKRFLMQMYPLATINWDLEMSTAVSYSRMIHAKYLICQSGLSCWLPALAAYKYASVRNDSELHIWTDSIPKLFTSHIQFYDNDFHQSDCLYLRGRLGSWEQDMDLAPALQYPTGVSLLYGGIYTETEIRDATTYKWTEKVFDSCNMELTTVNGMCEILSQLQVTRIFFLGDSMAGQQAKSLLLMLGQTIPKDFLLWIEVEIQCPATHSNFKIAYSRSDKLIEKAMHGPGSDYLQECHRCSKWSGQFLEHSGKQILVASTGLHYNFHHLAYQMAFKEWVRTLESFDRPDDIVFYRTTVAGHPNCHDPGTVPFKDFKEYDSNTKFSKTQMFNYGWDKFLKHNMYSEEFLAKRKRLGVLEKKNVVGIETLDVFPFTILRPDGHLNGHHKDCLHYKLPGPVDWWNHLLFNNLMDVAQKRSIIQP